LKTALELVYTIAHFMSPFCPSKCERIFKALKHDPVPLTSLNWNNLKAGTEIELAGNMFESFVGGSYEKTALREKEAKRKREEMKKAKQAKAADKAAQREAAKSSGEKLDLPIDKLCFTVGKIVGVESHPEADKLFVEMIDVGGAKPIQVVSGLQEHYTAEEFNGKDVVVFTNLKAGKFKGVMSNGMVMCGKAADGKTRVISPPKGSKIGERVRLEGVEFGEPLETAKAKGRKKKKSEWQLCQNEMKMVNGIATFQGRKWVTSAGPITCEVPDGQIA